MTSCWPRLAAAFAVVLTIFAVRPSNAADPIRVGYIGPVLPMTGHTSNIEEPAPFNQHVAEFLAAVESGRWGTWKRGPR